MKATALIAEDEPLLAANLQTELAALWPDLSVVDRVGHGAAAVERTMALRPDLLFLDVRMPGMTGLEAAQALAEDWPADGAAFPLIVFVTAYDHYAAQAFEYAAFDYVLKPVRTERLALTCRRLQETLSRRSGRADSGLAEVVSQLRTLLAGLGTLDNAPPEPAVGRLRVIRAAAGNTISMVPLDDVVYFEAADKYVRVVTRDSEHLIRQSLRELVPQLDAEKFWQIHRGSIVRCDAIASAHRDDTGKIVLHLRGHPDRLIVSRVYAHLFRGM